MHTVVSRFAFVWMTGFVAVRAAAVIRPPTPAGRILALDALTLIPVALLVLYADPPYFLDAALMLAFLGTVAAARYHGEGRIS